MLTAPDLGRIPCGMSRLRTARERRVLGPVRPVRRRESRPTGGGVFFRAQRPADVPGPEAIRDIFRRTLEGTALGKRLGY